MTEEQIKQNAEIFVKKDIKEIDDFMDNFLADLKCTRQQATALIELCRICYVYGAIETTEELQKENKDIQQSCENYYNEMRAYKNQVDKAKEIINEYLGWADWERSNCPSFESICGKAEAFLKGC